MIQIPACIVTCNPVCNKLRENMSAIAPQVPLLIVVDNGSNNCDWLRLEASRYSNAVIIENGANLGIAKALNIASLYALEQGFEWLLTLDQDSVCPSGYIVVMAQVLASNCGIGVLGPTIFDCSIGVVGHRPDSSCQDVNTCITSGAIVSLYAWEAVEGYDEYMFIDSVDFDFCYRVRKKGCRVCQTGSVVLYHKLGESVHRRFFNMKVRVPNYSAFRCYYRARNEIYYPRKNSLYLLVLRGLMRNVRDALIILLYEHDKRSKLGALACGFKDGLVIKIDR